MHMAPGQIGKLFNKVFKWVFPIIGHVLIAKTYLRFSQFFWPYSLNGLESFTKCQRSNQALNTQVGFQASEIPTASYQKLFIVL